jgi:acetyl-CoA carboxylase biotin carboxyl carrier protein
MVGTVYIAPEPGAPPFVRVGDVVKKGQTLLIIEAMKTMNPVTADRDGRVARVLVEDGAPTEYGEVLVILE